MTIVEWYQDRYDPDEVVDLLGITVEELVNAFEEKAHDFYDEYNDEEEEEDEQT